MRMLTHHRFQVSFLAVTALSLLVIASAYAHTIYNDGEIHNIDTFMPNGSILLDNKTTLNVLSGGSIIGVEVIGAVGISAGNKSTINVYDGSVAGGNGMYSEGIVLDNSMANIYGGSVTGGLGQWAEGIDVGNGSSLKIYGGNIKGGTAKDNKYWADGIQISGGSSVSIYDGSITAGTGSSANGIDISGSSIVNIFGGSINGGNAKYEAWGICAMDSSMINLYGGTITAGTGELDKGIAALGDSTVKIYGTGFNYGYGSINDISGILTGILSDGTYLNISFEQSYAGHIILSSVPEPATLLLLGLGGLYLRRNRRK